MDSDNAQSRHSDDSNQSSLPITYMAMPSANRSRMFSSYATDDVFHPMATSSAMHAAPTSSDAEFWASRRDLTLSFDMAPSQHGAQVNPTTTSYSTMSAAPASSDPGYWPPGRDLTMSISMTPSQFGSQVSTTTHSSSTNAAATSPRPGLPPLQREIVPTQHLGGVMRHDAPPTGTLSLNSHASFSDNEGMQSTWNTPDRSEPSSWTRLATHSQPSNPYENHHALNAQEPMWRNDSFNTWTFPQPHGHHTLDPDVPNGRAQTRPAMNGYAHNGVHFRTSFDQMGPGNIVSMIPPTGTMRREGTRSEDMLPEPEVWGHDPRDRRAARERRVAAARRSSYAAENRIKSMRRGTASISQDRIGTGLESQQPLPGSPLTRGPINSAQQRQTIDHRWFRRKILPDYAEKYWPELSDYFNRLSPREQSYHGDVRISIQHLHDELSDDKYSPVTREIARNLANSHLPDHKECEFQTLLHRFRKQLYTQNKDCKWVVRRSFFKKLQPMPYWQKLIREEDRRCDICCELYGTADADGVKEEPVELPVCKHIFGEICLKTWLREDESSMNCPKCRSKLPVEPDWAQEISEDWAIRAIRRRNEAHTTQTESWARAGRVNSSAAMPQRLVHWTAADALPSSTMPQLHLNPMPLRHRSPPQNATEERMKLDDELSESENMGPQGITLSPMVGEHVDGECECDMETDDDELMAVGALRNHDRGNGGWSSLVSSGHRRPRDEEAELLDTLDHLTQYQ